MSQKYCILNLLNIKDKNGKLDKNFYSEEKINNVVYKIIQATLSYIPKFCPCCGCIFDNKQTYEKNGFKTSNILILDVLSLWLLFKTKKKDSYVIRVIESSLLKLN